MNLRKSTYFKPLCLLVAALVTGQCVSIQKKLVSTEEKIIENNGSQDYVYELEKIKTASVQDPTVEYRIVKFPANNVESLNTYQTLKKVNKLNTFLGGFFIGALSGLTVSLTSKDSSPATGLKGTCIGALLGSLITLAIWSNKDAQNVEVKTSKPYLEKKPNSIPLPAQNLPLEFNLWTHGKRKSYDFKTQTDEQGIVKVNVIDELTMAKLSFDYPLTLFINYFTPESQKKVIFIDFLKLEK